MLHIFCRVVLDGQAPLLIFYQEIEWLVSSLDRPNRRKPMALTKINLVESICDEIGLTKKESTAVLDRLFDLMKDELSTGKQVMISGFGKWTVRNKRARVGRNPKTGERITINARKVVTFKESNTLRGSINSEG
jgi:integration host factor subunit alpha